MTQQEMAQLTWSLCRLTCSQVVQPQYYGSEGPFVVALDEKNGEPAFLCFSFAATDEFLAQPGAMPLALISEDFPFTITAGFDLEYLESSGNFLRFTFCKVAPDAPACRLAVEKLWRTDARTASHISLMGPSGELLAAKFFRKDSPLLS